ncbi:hypothetical protein [Dongia rigui]|uniref:Uncharacterized protein n=1 Tax=Dongia rigui TaxID=940149 RepID=A0ABU5DZG5_9PROT|nr:hypothetical protein [Dongia rigui]MDY0872028.1 hypothetical protein [Dongia rigui]
MTSFDFDVISDAPTPRVIKPADLPKTETPPAKDVRLPQEHLPRSDAA